MQNADAIEEMVGLAAARFAQAVAFMRPPRA